MPTPANTDKKRFLSVYFNCCHVYNRVYLNRDGSAYTGRCPRCLAPVSARVGEGGTNQRMFETRKL